MTRTEAKEILINRIAFIGENIDPNGKIYFEAVNSLVNIDLIDAMRPLGGNSLDEYILQQKELTVLSVLTDVFRNDDIKEDVINECISYFDNLILYKMNIRMIEMFLTSQRSNRTERISNESLQMLHYDLNGNSSNSNLPYNAGLRRTYLDLLDEVKSTFGTLKSLNTSTIKWWC